MKPKTVVSIAFTACLALARPASAELIDASTYLVGQSETLREIALKLYGSTRFAQEIARANSLGDPDRLQVGSRLRLPKPPTVSAAHGNELSLLMWRQQLDRRSETLPEPVAPPQPVESFQRAVPTGPAGAVHRAAERLPGPDLLAPSWLELNLLARSLSLHEENLSPLTQTESSLRLQSEIPILASVWSAHLQLDADLFALASDSSGARLRSVVAAAHLAYDCVPAGARFRISLRAGAFYTNLAVTGAVAGFSDLFGFELYPFAQWTLPHGGMISGYARYSPYAQADFTYRGTLNGEIGAGLAYRFARSRWGILADYRHDSLSTELYDISFGSLGLGASYAF